MDSHSHFLSSSQPDASSKHAAQAFFDALRAEVSAAGVNITNVNPGYIQTNLSKNAFSPDGTQHGGERK